MPDVNITPQFKPQLSTTIIVAVSEKKYVHLYYP